MKWLVIASFMALATLCDGSAVRCPPGSKDATCSREQHINKDLRQPSSRKERKGSEVECLAGSEWESNCHKCRCSEKGYPDCVRLENCDSRFDEPTPCKANTTFKRDCNTCTCLENGLALCTIAFCQIGEGVRKLPSGVDCLPGSSWESGCNACSCSESGYAMCTEMACPGREHEPERTCAPDTMWLKECNTCSCSPEGEPICTRMRCFKFNSTGGSWNGDEDKEATPDQYHNVVDHKRLKRSPVCKPNAFLKADCNFCKCSSDGQSYSCTLHDCPEHDLRDDVEVFKDVEDDDQVDIKVCKPRGTFYIGCNTCHCNVDGTSFTCTNKPCPLPDDVEIFHELRELRTSQNNDSVVCAANRMFIKDCNTCWCNEDGTSYFCTRKVCVAETPDDLNEGKPEEIKRKCRPDEVFEMDCNTCRCAQDGMSFSCTRKACVPEEKGKGFSLNRRVRATSQELPKACQPGQEFRLDCNKCLCNNEGQDFSCTRIDCAALNSNGNGGVRKRRDVATQMKTDCVPGSVFNQDCNLCRCTDDGIHAVCSLKRCKDNNPNKTSNDLPESDPNFRCNPGEQYKRDCNDCTCSADGKSIFCTLRLCDQDLTPTI